MLAKDEKQPLCAITMVRQDYEMLSIWVQHYKKHIADFKSIYVISHGEDSKINEIASGCTVITIPFDESGKSFEQKRRKFLLMFASGLLSYFRNVLVVDCDELLAVDPMKSSSLSDYLDTIPNTVQAISPIGFDIRQKLSIETQSLDASKPLLSQRVYGFVVANYCKPCIIRTVITSGTAHRLPGLAWHIDPNLILFHLKYADKKLSQLNLEARKTLVGSYKSNIHNHGIKGDWEKGFDSFAIAAQSVEEDCTNFEPENMQDEIIPRLQLALKRRGKVPNFSYGPYQIPKRFRNLI